jgi:1,4-dihydroxy-6-naphthoate synthase
MKLTLGFSTCPNDTFIFDAMVHGKIDTEGLVFDLFMADVEELNQRAFKHDIHITKLSYHAFAQVARQYILLNAGSALGRKNGPLVIGRPPLPDSLTEEHAVAIPGKHTTANLLFSIFYPHVRKKPLYLFSAIEDALLQGKADAGVIIHESRFTYAQKGLLKIADLGEMWETRTGLPIPLGGIAIDRALPESVQLAVDRVLKRSVTFALANYDSSAGFVKSYAQELDNAVICQHIDLYVNEYTVDLGEEGRMAVSRLFGEAVNIGIIPAMPDNYLLHC